MALIEVFHVVADEYPVDPDFQADTLEGMLVRLTSIGGEPVVKPATAASGVIGIAGDTQSNTTAATQWSARLILNSNGGSLRQTVNRVSDMFNETAASGKMTVYHSGGTFRSDQFATLDSGQSPITYSLGDPLYSNDAGKITNESGAGGKIGLLVEGPKAFPSGVPGTETPDGSMSLGTYMTLKLLV